MFNFNAPSSSGASSGGLFGTSNTSSPFGSNQNNSNTGSSGGGLFGNVGAPASSTPGTSSTSTPSLFGNTTSTPQAPSFGSNASSGASGTTTPSFSFGNQNTSGSGTQSPSLFGSGSQTPKASEASAPAQSGTGGLFGSAPKPAGSLFGGNTATPGPSGGGSLFNNPSTTPAGPPPQSGAGSQGQSLFGQTAQKPGGLFGNTNTATTSSAAPSTTTTTATSGSTTPSLFGGGSQPQSGGGLFGSNAQQPQKPLFGSTPSAPTGGGLFSNAGKDKPAESTTPATSADSGAKPLFGAPAGGQGAQSSSPFKMPSPGATTTTTAESSTPATSTTTPAKSLFPAPGGTTSSATPSSTPAAAPSTGGLFGAPKSTETSTPGTAATSAPSTQPAAPTGGLFGKPAGTAPSTQPASTSTSTAAESKPATTAPSTATAGATAGTTGAAPTPGLGASTTGPTPPAQSRLKNKTMDEIITRWATDLTKYQKDFREQAEQVAEWDRMLVENGSKVQKLYGSTVDAERATQEVERQLSSVEGQQEELSSWLDRYEREVDEMMSKQVGPGEALQGPDQERERTYKLAEKLSERLDDMGKDLTSMIEEVNGASATLSKTSKADEPISQIVRVLNSHLSQLQVIDQGTTELQDKVNAAQKVSQSLSSRFGHGFSSSGMGGGGNAADDFYRSYMGRR